MMQGQTKKRISTCVLFICEKKTFQLYFHELIWAALAKDPRHMALPSSITSWTEIIITSALPLLSTENNSYDDIDRDNVEHVEKI